MSRLDDVFPALQRRTRGQLNRTIDPVRDALWCAFQRGDLTEEEFVSTVARLEAGSSTEPPTWLHLRAA